MAADMAFRGAGVANIGTGTDNNEFFILNLDQLERITRNPNTVTDNR